MHFRELKLHITNNPIIPLVLFLIFYYLFVSISICKDVVLIQDDHRRFDTNSNSISMILIKGDGKEFVCLSLDVGQLKHLCCSVTAGAGRDWN